MHSVHDSVQHNTVDSGNKDCTSGMPYMDSKVVDMLPIIFVFR